MWLTLGLMTPLLAGCADESAGPVPAGPYWEPIDESRKYPPPTFGSG